MSEDTNRQLAAAQQAQNAEIQQTDLALQKEFGDKYNYALDMMTRGMGGKGSAVQHALLQAGLAGKPEIIRAFIALGETLKESSGPKGDGAPGADKMKSVHEGGGFSY